MIQMPKRKLKLSNYKNSTYLKRKKTLKLIPSCYVSTQDDTGSSTDTVSDTCGYDSDCSTTYKSSEELCTSSESINCSQCCDLQQFFESASLPDFLGNLCSAIKKGLLQEGNIALLLFADFIQQIVNKSTFRYHPQTLMWWITGWKTHGTSWLTKMRGTQDKPNFAVPSVNTLRTLCPKAVSLSGYRRPGNCCHLHFA